MTGPPNEGGPRGGLNGPQISTKGRSSSGINVTTNPADLLLSRLDGVRETGPGRWLARCPAHDDRSASLSIRDADDRVLIHCFAGCDPGDVLSTVGLTLADLYDRLLDHYRPPSRSRIPASDAMVAIDREALVVATIAADMRAHREIDDATWDRLTTAVARIGAARDRVSPRKAQP